MLFRKYLILMRGVLLIKIKHLKKPFALFDQALSDVTLRNADTKMKADIWYWKGRAHQADFGYIECR